MRYGWLAIAGVLLGGCAAQPPAAEPPAVLGPTHASAALAFDPPVARGDQTVDGYLSRTGRGQAAFAGFEQTTTSYFDQFTYNRNAPDGENYVDRQTYVDRVGSITR